MDERPPSLHALKVVCRNLARDRHPAGVSLSDDARFSTDNVSGIPELPHTDAIPRQYSAVRCANT